MRITRFVLILAIPFAISCNRNSSKIAKSDDINDDIRYTDSIAAVEDLLMEKSREGEKINAFLDEYISKNPNWFNNTIQREKTGKELRALLEKKLKETPDFLSDIPVEFASIDKVKSTDNKGYKYLISFTRSSLDKTGKYYISFRIITAVDEEEKASSLIDNNKYYLKGEFIDFSEKKSFKISTGIFDTEVIEIGSIFIKNPVITPV